MYFVDRADAIPVLIFANTVAATEEVSVIAGKFKTWKVSRASNATDLSGVITSENGCYAPEIGLPVNLLRSIGDTYVGQTSSGRKSSKLSETWEMIVTNTVKEKK